MKVHLFFVCWLIFMNGIPGVCLVRNFVRVYSVVYICVYLKIFMIVTIIVMKLLRRIFHTGFPPPNRISRKASNYSRDFSETRRWEVASFSKSHCHFRGKKSHFYLRCLLFSFIYIPTVGILSIYQLRKY